MGNEPPRLFCTVFWDLQRRAAQLENAPTRTVRAGYVREVPPLFQRCNATDLAKRPGFTKKHRRDMATMIGMARTLHDSAFAPRANHRRLLQTEMQEVAMQVPAQERNP